MQQLCWPGLQSLELPGLDEVHHVLHNLGVGVGHRPPSRVFLGHVGSQAVGYHRTPAAEDQPVAGNLLALADEQEVRRTVITTKLVDVTDNSFLSFLVLTLDSFPIVIVQGSAVKLLCRK